MSESVMLDVELRRAPPKGHSQHGSFGFSIMGGVGYKLPAVICEMDETGPAMLSGQMSIGDQLVRLNGEDTSCYTPKQLVERIRAAPTLSVFSIVHDPQLQVQVFEILQRQEEKRRKKLNPTRSTSACAAKTDELSHSSRGGKPRKASAPSQLHRDTRKPAKVLEIETSVNEKLSSGIVHMRSNKILTSSTENLDTVPEDSHSKPLILNTSTHSPHVSSASSSASSTPHHSISSPDHVSSGAPYLSSTSSHNSLSAAASSSGISVFPVDSVGALSGSPSDPKVSNPSSVGEVTSGGAVFVRKPSGTDLNESPKVSTSKSSPSVLKKGVIIPPSPGPSLNKRNGGVRMSLTEEVLIQEIALSSQEESILEMAGTHAKHEPHRANKHDSPNKRSGCLLETQRFLSPPQEGSESEDADDLGDHSRNSTCSTGSAGCFFPEAYRARSPQASQGLVHKTRRSSSNRDSFGLAVTLARKLYMLDGFKKAEVAEKLADRTEFGKAVAKEYLKCFDFEKQGLDEAMRVFLSSFSLVGESQERERIMQHFSERYFESNEATYPSLDVVHGLACALLLLNSDLHTDHGRSKMSLGQFVTSLERINVNISRNEAKKLYRSIKKRPLEGAGEELLPPENSMDSHSMDSDTARVYHVTIPGTFVEVELPETAPVFKEGYLLRKNIMDAPHKKVPRGKRQWKHFYVYLKGFLLYFVPPDGQLHLEDTSNALVITHCLAMRASDYSKRSAVLRLTTSDWHAFLLQTQGIADLQQWIASINKAAAMYSAPPLAAPVGSSSKFQRPTFPIAPTKNTVEQQKELHETRVKNLERELMEHQLDKERATKSKNSSDWFERYEFLQFEISRFRIYIGSLQSDALVEYQGPLPTGLQPSPSISTLATPGMGDELSSEYRRSSSPGPPYLSPRRESPLVEHKFSIEGKR